MGLNWNGVKFLASVRSGGTDFARTVTIGRQNLHVPLPQVRQILDGYKIPNTLDDKAVLASPEFAEPVFKLLGANIVDSIDASDYEKATIIADMNEPVPKAIYNSYDIVFDGGSLEHVFNVEQALRNVMSLPKIGGSVIIHTMANNCLGHGLYQFSPELFYRVFSPENGYRVERVVLHPNFGFAHWYDVPDPTEVHSRIELASNFDAIMMFVHAIRQEVLPIFKKNPQQSDYAATWEDHAAATASDLIAASTEAGHRTLKRRVIEVAKARLPWAVRAKHQMAWAMPYIPRLINGIKHRRECRRFSIHAQPAKFRSIDQ
jgi:hypothetical protein